VVPDAKELKALEDENRLLKQMVATQASGIEALKAMVAKEMMTGRPPQASGFLRGGTSSSATQACKHPRPPAFERLLRRCFDVVFGARTSSVGPVCRAQGLTVQPRKRNAWRVGF
jgi:hypothetical protein